MSNPKIGQIIRGEEFRDAIHIAIAPVEATQNLAPGEPITVDETGTKASASNIRDMHGIVDPFLTKAPVKPGERFWILLKPNTIQNLRHQWVHPAFPDEVISDVGKSKLWISNWAASLGLDYDEVMSAAEAYVDYDDYWTEGGRFEGWSVPAEFWDHYRALTGKTRKWKGSFFSCSC